MTNCRLSFAVGLSLCRPWLMQMGIIYLSKHSAYYCFVLSLVLCGEFNYRVSHLGRSMRLPDAIWPFVPRTVRAKAIVWKLAETRPLTLPRVLSDIGFFWENDVWTWR
jgi:hypothetical protein